MDVAALSVLMQQSSLSQQMSVAVAKKAMDTAEQSGNELVKMLEKSVNPNLGSKIDVKI